MCSRSSFRHESRLPPIFLADHPEIMKELLTAGANHLVIPDPGHMNTITVLQMAYLRGNYAVAQVLENWGGDVALTPLHTAAAMNNTGRIRQFLRRKVDPDCLGELGYIGLNKRTPLHWASVNGAINAMELLLDANANADAQDARGRTPLHWAARVNQVEAVKVLLGHGADPNIVDDGGMSAIMCAACAGGTTAEMFKALVSHGANINHQLPSTGDTALHIAVKLDDLPTAVALLSVGGDIMRMNHEGLRPIDCTTSTRLQFEIKRAAGNRDVMISYTHSHKEFALKLRKTLEDANITTWLDLMDPSGIGGGAVWREEIARGVTNAAVVVCILTEDYAQSPWCMKELALAKQVGTPILAISTENTKISEELQVYLYTRQIIPFEPSITRVNKIGDKQIEYHYDEEEYKKQVRLLLDGLRDEIEKRKEQVLRRNLSRAATSSTLNTSNSSNSALNNANVGSGGRGRAVWSQGSSNAIGGVAAYSNNTMQFDERAPAAMMQEKLMLETTNREGFVFSSSALNGLHTGQTNRRGQDLFDTNNSVLSTGSFIDGNVPEEVSFRGYGVDDLAKSIIVNQNGYYVHRPEEDFAEQNRKTSVASSGTVLETFKEAKDIVDDGQQFVFICHADWHTSFVHRLCSALCREGGLHCYVGRRSRLGRTGSRIDDITPQQAATGGTQPASQRDEAAGNDEDMMDRIHEAKEAILKCSAFVLVISEKTLRSQLVKDQIAFAEDKGKKIIPVVVNPLEFSLDMQYSLARSDFYHFFTSGDMIGFEKSLDRVLAALREEVYGISIEPSMMSTSRLPKSFSLSQIDSMTPTSFVGSDANLRRRRGSNASSIAEDTGSIVGSSRGWMDLPASTRMNRSFIVGSSSTPTSRALNSDMSLQQAMLGNFSSLMRHVTDEDEEEDELGVDEEILEEELEDESDHRELHRSTSEPVMPHGGSFHLSEHELGHGRSPAFRPMLDPRPGRLSSIMSTSGRSVSILERASGDEATSIDGIKFRPERSPASRPL